MREEKRDGHRKRNSIGYNCERIFHLGVFPFLESNVDYWLQLGIALKSNKALRKVRR